MHQRRSIYCVVAIHLCPSQFHPAVMDVRLFISHRRGTARAALSKSIISSMADNKGDELTDRMYFGSGDVLLLLFFQRRWRQHAACARSWGGLKKNRDASCLQVTSNSIYCRFARNGKDYVHLVSPKKNQTGKIQPRTQRARLIFMGINLFIFHVVLVFAAFGRPTLL